MRLSGLTLGGVPLDDPAILERVPGNLASLLRQMNGLVALRGAFHLRAACQDPTWHSLRAAMEGPHALAHVFGEVTERDVPFAEDCLGNQFLLRGRDVWHLDPSTGSLRTLGGGLKDFLQEVARSPERLVNMGQLERFENAGGRLRPGRLLRACSGAGAVSLRSVPALELLRYRGLVLSSG